MAGGMKAEHHLGSRGPFDAEALNADGNAAVGTDPEGGAEAPNIRPPGAAWDRAEHGPLFFLGKFPGPLRDHVQFAMGFVGVTMESQSVDMGVGEVEFGNLFAGEIGGKPALPELVLALDFSLGLGCGAYRKLMS